MCGDDGQRTFLGHDAGAGGCRPGHILMSDKRGADWGMQAEHVCKLGGCGSGLSMKQRPELAEIYAEALVGNSEMQTQFEQAIMAEMIAKEDPVNACETASCREKHRVFIEALRTGQPLHAREFVRTPPRRQYKIQVWWSKRAYTRRQRDVFLGRLY
eukprot:265158-Pelagomonas_calceolata.AAC.1